MRDYLICLPDVPADATSIGDWAGLAEGDWRFTLPLRSAPLPVIAYEDLGVPATYDGEGAMLDAGTSPVPAPGWWAIVTLSEGEVMPEQLVDHIAAEGDREAGLALPVGVVGLSTVWAGMRVMPS